MDRDDSDWKATAKAVPELRLLRWLVAGLALVMGLGMIAIVALLWMRFAQPVLPALPASIALPAGAKAQAVTFGPDWIAVVTQAGELLLYDRSGALRDRLQP